jgi:hypothetical protein
VVWQDRNDISCLAPKLKHRKNMEKRETMGDHRNLQRKFSEFWRINGICRHVA